MKAENLTANSFVLDPKASADLRLKLKQDPQAGLKQAAQQFEGMLLQMMLKSMRDATPQDGLMDSDQTRFFTSIMDQQLAQNLSAKGQLGFAKLIEQQLGRTMAGGTTADPASSLEALQQTLIAQQAASSAGSMSGAERIRSTPAAVVSSVSSAASTPAGRNTDFVNRVWPQAIEAAKATGLPPQFLVAHAALESGWGKSEIRAADGSPSYNLFGVKAGRSWQGPTVEVKTTEYVNGVAQTSREKFRVYGSYAESFNDYANLLKNNSRFSAVLGQQDGTQFAKSLQQSGYATDPLYADKLSRIINGPTLRQALAG
ncbi:flagellar assembly peptidoglycan hydrolase FlgJ [Propionivibrio sp.]|uniref:flagellar assembly peptidoglycan hydrolase FlgJ n=1 Tax=Propionivibrio sp. TaxID=2212460 RepID=UPI003BF17D96